MTKATKDKVKSNQITRRTLIFAAAYLMEEDGWDEDKILDFFNGITRWSEAYNEHLITLKTVCDLIEKKTGTKFNW